MNPQSEKPGGLLLRREDALAVVIDIQEKLLPAIADAEAVLERSLVFVSAMRLLGVPLLCTEQYPQGLGPTVEPLRAALADTPVLAKMSFGCLGDGDFRARLEASGRGALILCGIESHVCVLQTALAARERGLSVHVLEDAVGSRRAEDKAAGLVRLRQAGCVVNRVEMAVFELLGHAGAPEFKALLKLLK